MQKRALLVVSFGTSFAKTREKTIGRIESDFAEAFPNCRIYRAWTSKKIIAKILERDGEKILTVEEAVKQMLADGIQEVIVQPTHLINGIENEQMKADVKKYQQRFARISFGLPLLTTTEDQRQAIQAVMEEFTEMGPEDALVFMGHGTIHHANAVYVSMDYTLKDMGYSRVFLGCVESYPSLDVLVKKVGEIQPQKVYLAPFMLVAGDHALHDMAGEQEDSWKNRFEKEGLVVECVMKGVGEYPGIRKMYIEHGKEAERRMISDD